MALPDSVKQVTGTSYIFAYDTDWAGGSNNWSDTVDAEINLTNLSNAAARQSAKLDLTANRDLEYLVEAHIETDADATDGGTIDVYAGYSGSATNVNDNPAELQGQDLAYSGGTNGVLAGGLRQLEYIGSLVLQTLNDTDAEPQVGVIGRISPSKRYMMIVVVNNSGVALGSGGTGLADELAIRVTGITTQIQD
jgi:hypothetical protein